MPKQAPVVGTLELTLLTKNPIGKRGQNADRQKGIPKSLAGRRTISRSPRAGDRKLPSKLAPEACIAVEFSP